jgi:dTDP-4-amino-4,6-dideoxygalactose transaminase
VAESLVERILSLPLYPQLRTDELCEVSQAIRAFAG